MRALVLAALCGATWTSGAVALQVEAEAENAAPAAADLTAGPLPETPAFVFLGTSPSEITRPTTLKNLGAGLAQGIDENGRVLQGVAFELTPAFYLTSVTLKQYREDWSKYALSNLQLTLATVRTSGDSANTDLALGLRLPIFDAGDPMRNQEFTRRIAERMTACAQVVTPPPPDADPNAPPESVDRTAFIACMDSAAAPVAKEWLEDHWNASALTLAAATGTRLTSSRFSDRRWLGTQLWLAGALGLGDWGQFIVQGSYLDSRLADADALEYKATALGARLLAGGRRINGFAELSGETRFDRSDAVKKDDGRWSAGIEFLVGDDLWLSTGLGSTYQELDEPERTLVFANLRWGVSEKARMTPQEAGGQ
jgi:hypothetical protein